MKPSRGVLYAVHGQRWRDEAIRSVASVRRHHPDLPIVVFTDDVDDLSDRADADVRELPDRTWIRSEPKLWAVAQSPFDRTLFLDSDTLVLGDLSPLFDALEQYDLVACAAHRRHDRPRPGHADVECPVPAPQQALNSGVLAYGASDAVTALWADWWGLYQQDKARVARVKDQPSLRVALYRSAVRVCIAPQEFNTYFRFQPWVVVGDVVVLHGRANNIDAVARRINSSTAPRLWHPWLGPTFSRVLRWTARRSFDGARLQSRRRHGA